MDTDNSRIPQHLIIAANQNTKEKNYWMSKLAGELSVNHFPRDIGADGMTTAETGMETLEFVFPDELNVLLMKVGNRSDKIIHIILTAGLSVLLNRLTGSRDICIGTPVYRQETQAEFINTIVPLRNAVDPRNPFKDLLVQSRQTVIHAVENQDYPLQVLIHQLGLPVSATHCPLFHCGLLLENIHDPQYFEDFPYLLDTLFYFRRDGDRITGTLTYDPRYYLQTSMQRWVNHLQNLLLQALDNVDTPIADLEIFSQEEITQLLEAFNPTEAVPFPELPLHRLFEEQVERTPDHVALVAPVPGQKEHFQTLTYRQLDRSANHLAGILREKGVSAGTIVAVLVDSPVDMAIGALGILKAGGAYLPIDPAYPDERISFMLKDSAAPILLVPPEHLTDCTDRFVTCPNGNLPPKNQILSQRGNPETLHADVQVACIVLRGDRLQTCPYNQESAGSNGNDGTNDIAYIIYTSGTTGRPKGVMVEHCSVVNTLWHRKDVYGLDGTCVCLQLFSFAFDGFVTSFFTPLISGSTVVFPGGSGARDLGALKKAVLLHRVSHFISIPPLFQAIIESLEPREARFLKAVTLAGDKTPPELPALVAQQHPNLEIVNEYGVTEAAVMSTIFRHQEKDPVIKIGAPTANTAVYILAPDHRLQPVGVPGELCIAGTGVARGYLNRPQLTAERFFSPLSSLPSPLYSTGDLARWTADGHIRFLGRKDHQVKIRGYRIETGEIQQVLNTHPTVKESLVTARTRDNGEAFLCAYVVSAGGEQDPARAQLKEHLQQRLPDYMVPAHVIVIPQFPLTPGGKIDRSALPEPGKPGAAESEAPRTPTEKILAEVWADVLGLQQVGIGDNFFEIGGDSIKALQITSRLTQHRLKFEISDLFDHPRIEELAPHVTTVKRQPDQGPVMGEVPLTPIQSWFFHSRFTGGHHFNQSLMIHRPEGFDVQLLEGVLEKLMNHHDALRMVFEEKDGTPRQINRSTGEIRPYLREIEINETGEENTAREVEKHAQHLQESFVLHEGPLLKALLFHTPGGQHLLLTAHHLVVDGISWRILLEDLETLYKQAIEKKPLELPPKTDSYLTWAQWLQTYGQSNRLKQEKTYWQNIENTPVHPLPADHPPQDRQNANTYAHRNRASMTLDQTMTRSLLTNVHHAYNTEINDLLLTALALALHSWTNGNSFALNLEGHGRETLGHDIDISRTVGWFTSQFPVILPLQHPNNPSHTLREIKEVQRRIPNRGMGYGLLKYSVASGGPPGAPARGAPGGGSPWTPDCPAGGALAAEVQERCDRNTFHPEINFNYLGQFGEGAQAESGTEEENFFGLSPFHTGDIVSPHMENPYALDFSGMIAGGQLVFALSYNRHRFNKETIDSLVSLFKTRLEEIIHHCLEQETSQPTPSDLGCADLSITQLEKITREVGSPIQSIYPLSPMQTGMLFHWVKDPGSPAYFQQTAMAVNGNLDPDLLDQSMQILARRCDVLRTLFLHENLHQPLQAVLAERGIPVEHLDISHLDGKELEQEVETYKQKDRERGFRLSAEPLMRLGLLQTGPRRFVMVWSFHHLIMDGWCLSIIYNQLGNIYLALSNGETPHPEPVTPYRDYIQWLGRRDREESLDFWRNYLEGFESITPLPALVPIAEESELPGSAEYRLVMDQDLTSALDRTATQRQITVNTLVQTLWGLLLQRYNNTHDALFGAVVSGRPAEIPGIETMVGLFINTVPVRVNTREGEDLEQLLARMQENALAARDHEFVSLADIQALSPLKGELLDHILVFENYPIQEQVTQKDAGDEGANTPDFQVETVDIFEETNYPFSLAVVPGPRLMMQFSFSPRHYTPGFIETAAGHLETLARTLTLDPGVPLSRVDILTEAEKHRLLSDFNGISMEFPLEKSIPQLLVEQSEKFPHHAVLQGPAGDEPAPDEITLTYAELNRLSSLAATQLAEKGVVPGGIVAIMAQRSLDMVIAILGILKTGAAYLPIDPGYPDERIKYILADSAAPILLVPPERLTDCTDRFVTCPNGNLPQGIQIIDLKSLHLPLYARPQDVYGLPNQESAVGGGDTAYIIYTSGTTGTPKGVAVPHRAVVNRMTWVMKQYGLNADDRVLHKTPATFDVSVCELFRWILPGARLCLLPPGADREPRQTIDFMIRHRVTTVDVVPSMLTILLEELSASDVRQLETLRWVFTGAETVSPGLTARFREVFREHARGQLVNAYGPTEATVDVTYFNCSAGESLSVIPIGKPMANVQVRILDVSGRLQPAGAAGELCIGGPCLAHGYLNRPELTSERFVTSGGGEGEPEDHLFSRFYRSGDLACWLPDGNIRFLGRIDHQVKVRGFRVETGEIEAVLLTCETVKETVVTVVPDASGNNSLCAYFTTPRPGDVEVEPLRDHLEQRLPDYMVPAYFVPLTELPLTSSGKIDRAALPAPVLKAGEAHVIPRGEVEERLAEIWAGVLGVEQVGAEDHFFEMGGDSIKALQILSRLRKYRLTFQLSDLFDHPRIRALAPYTTPIQREPDQGPVEGEVPLTPIQHWFFQRDFTGKHHYNQAVMLHREEGFDITSLEKALTGLVEHHDALRMVFKIEDGAVRQYNLAPTEISHPLALKKLHTEDWEALGREIETASGEIQTGLDLAEGPLYKFLLFETPRGHFLLLVIHHLVVDGYSWRILLEDLERAYRRALAGKPLELPAKTDAFMYWARQLREQGLPALPAREREYWRALEAVDVPPLPGDRRAEPDLEKQRHMRRSIVELDEESTTLLVSGIHHAYNTEINDILLAALVRAVGQWAGAAKVAVCLEGHGREPVVPGIDLSRTLGWFTSQYPVVFETEPAAGHDLSLILRSVKETLRRVPRRGIGYGMLVYLDTAEGEEPRELLQPEISFNYLGQLGGEANTGQGAGENDVAETLFKMSPFGPGASVSPDMETSFLLDFNGFMAYGCLTLTVGYNMFNYDAASIDGLAESYRETLLDIIRHCGARETSCPTPSDLGYSSLSIEQLEQLSRRVGGDIEQIYPLSPLQAGMHYHWLRSPRAAAYYEQVALGLEGNLRVPWLQESFNRVVSRYHVLRTVFIHENVPEPLQVVLEKLPVTIGVEDISHLEPPDGQAYIEEFRRRDQERGFDLARGPLLRVTVIRTGEDTCTLVWGFHHIVMDGWCFALLYRELMDIYLSMEEGSEPQLPPVTPYRNYIDWLGEQDTDEGLAYWEAYTAGLEEPTGLPFGSTVGESMAVERGEVSLELDVSLTEALNRLAVSSRVTLNTLVQMVWGILLQRYNDTADALFGAVVSGRPAEIDGVEDMVGLFINTLPVRVVSDREITFTSLAVRMQEAALASARYEHLSLADIQARSPLKDRLITHVMAFENYPMQQELSGAEQQDAQLKVTQVANEEQTHYDFTLAVLPGRRLGVRFIFNRLRYRDEYIKNTAGHFRYLVEQLTAEPGMRVSEAELLTETEKEKLLLDFNRTGSSFPEDKTIHQLFEEQVERTPDRVALVTEPGTNTAAALTYRELDARADSLARRLSGAGVGPDVVVALMTGRGGDMIAGMLGILKAGAAFLPLDPDLPDERIKYMLADSAASTLITTPERITDCTDRGSFVTCPNGNLPPGIEILDIEGKPAAVPLHENTSAGDGVSDWDRLQTCPYGRESAGTDKKGNSGNPAFIIYTSGSTGKPKGVMLEHRGVANIHVHHRENFGIRETDRLTQFASPAFDASVFELVISLLNGAALVVVNESSVGNYRAYEAFLNRHAVTVAFLPPAYASNLEPGVLKTLRMLITGGSAPAAAVVNRWTRRVDYINAYGPTESTIFVTAHRFERGGPAVTGVSIGGPVINTRAFVVDSNLRLQPPGVPGQLIVATPGLARGYLNRPEQTAERFVGLEGRWEMGEGSKNKEKNAQNKIVGAVAPARAEGPLPSPLSPLPSQFYLTGDRVRRLPDGTLEFLGRIDRQVKIRGFRVELEEIENHLLRHESVKEAVVVDLKKEHGDEFLCAYIVPRESAGIEPGILKTFLSRSLPGYMIPLFFISLEEMPLTPSGKPDRRRLPAPDTAVGETADTPRDETEEQLVRLWAAILDIPAQNTGLHTPFADLGGHSLKATRLAAEIHRCFQVEIPLAEIFQLQTVSRMAQYIRGAKTTAFDAVLPAEEREYYPLSLQQERLWLLSRVNPGDTSYNMPGTISLSHRLEPGILEKTLARLMRRHDAFRTGFKEAGGSPVQFIIPPGTGAMDFRLQTADYSTLEPTAAQGAAATLMLELTRTPFDLLDPPLFRGVLVKWQEEHYEFFYVVHHIIFDGWSQEVLSRDFKTIYETLRDGRDAALQPPPVRYRDFALWQRRRMDNPAAGSEAHRYWLEQLRPGIPPLPLPRDRESRDNAGSMYRRVVPEATAAGLNRMARENETTLFVTLFAAYGWLLAYLSGQPEVVCQIIDSGRDHADVQEIVGFFINAVPARLAVNPDEDFSLFLRRIAGETLERFRHRWYPLEPVLEELKTAYPDIPTAFNMLNLGEPTALLEDAALEPVHVPGTGAVKFDIVLQVTEYTNGIQVTWEYRRDCYEPGTIEMFAGAYSQLLENILSQTEES